MHFRCPHCGQKGVAFKHKKFLGPLYPAKCEKCGRRISMLYTYSLLLAPLVVVSMIVIESSLIELVILLMYLILIFAAKLKLPRA
jgi:uncharacterized protein (DUF983 family)